jgi:hypothetical protein
MLTKTATNSRWMPYDDQPLWPGDEVEIADFSRKLAGKTGIVEGILRKNVSVIIDGEPWRVAPCLINRFRRGNPDNLPVAKKAVVDCNPSGLLDCEVGDVVLMFRGAFDVVKVVQTLPLRCEALDGRGKGKIYRYQPSMFVQKLDSERFS